MQLRTDPLHAAFDLTLALVDDEEQRDLLARVLAAGRPAVDKAAYEVVREVVAGINEDLGDAARIELTYTPDGVTVLVTQTEPDMDSEDLAAMSDEVERLTLRLPAEVKDLAASIAADAAVSLNTWIVRSVVRALERTPGPDQNNGSGRRKRGAGGSLRGRVGS
jgi:hypothetical protein